MKKITSQISIGIVCMLLAFMITYQLKVVMRQNEELDDNKNVAQITVEIDSLKKQKENLDQKVNELQGQIKKYEDAAANNDQVSKEIVKKLEDTRILTGNVDVEGEGVIIYLTPESNFFVAGDPSSKVILDIDIVTLLNELNAADAEAISVNDIRVTSRTGIRSTPNYITINQDRISGAKRITIKAIGNKTNLKAPLEFPRGIVESFDKNGIKVEYKESDNIKIDKTNGNLKFKYAKPIKKD